MKGETVFLLGVEKKVLKKIWRRGVKVVSLHSASADKLGSLVCICLFDSSLDNFGKQVSGKRERKRSNDDGLID
ncbi:hypothetical protein C7N43_10935 [Sphingobacteriales bacterium UPWRP_1]|nr:hypothetical protein C7N43_10935 [Sphingobacteriales bacterium UPWRP_1]